MKLRQDTTEKVSIIEKLDMTLEKYTYIYIKLKIISKAIAIYFIL